MSDPAPAGPPFPREIRIAVGFFILSAVWTGYHLVSSLLLSLNRSIEETWILEGSHLVLQVLCIMGLARRSAWGWWTSVFYLGVLCLGSVHTIRFIVAYSQGQFNRGEFPIFLMALGGVLGLLAGGVLVLLIRCRRRGAYAVPAPA